MNTSVRRHISVSLLVQPYATLTYALPLEYQYSESLIGSRVLIPLGYRREAVLGIIVSLGGEKLPEGIIAKDIYWVLDTPSLLYPHYIDIVQQLALRQGITIGVIFSHILPAPLRSTKFKIRFFDTTASTFTIEEILTFSHAEYQHYITLWKNGKSAIIQGNIAEYDMYSLAKEPPWEIKANAKKQHELLQLLWEEGSLSKEELVEQAGKGVSTTLQQMVKRSFVAVAKAEDIIDTAVVLYSKGSIEQPECTEEQKKILKKLTPLIGQESRPELLFGVTGSGKSRIYCELIAECLRINKNAIILAPEVALVHKLGADIAGYFENTPYCIYHGYQNPIIKKNIFQTIRKSKENIILIGTRSALFVPIENIGLIILDEEHDASYKQDTGAFMYQAKEVAWTIAKKEKALLLLGSATPDIKTFYASTEGAIGSHILKNRATGAKMPHIQFINMKTNKNVLAEETITAIKETIARKEQVILLLNRRGYTPYMYCIACGTVQKCPHCEISLMYHKSLEILRCTYCGYNTHFPKPCVSCQSLDFLPLGCGTEKLQEELISLFPQEELILRLDRDIARNPATVDSILQQFSNGEASILVGTQMLAKGHDFPKVSLSIIVDADVGLHFPDYRATERTFQLLVQTAGRAGRGAYAGNVIVQTVDPDHYCWAYVKENNYEDLYQNELALRKRRGYPPFMRLALIRFRFLANDKKNKEYIENIGSILHKNSKGTGLKILGPSPSPIALVRGYSRYQCMIKGSNWNEIRSFYASLKQYMSKTKGIYMSLDLDPISMM